MPPHTLILKKGIPVILLRNLNPYQGLYNGTRLIVLNVYHGRVTRILEALPLLEADLMATLSSYHGLNVTLRMVPSRSPGRGVNSLSVRALL